jgi:hypothetical protein
MATRSCLDWPDMLKAKNQDEPDSVSGDTPGNVWDRRYGLLNIEVLVEATTTRSLSTRAH